jgi:subtilisin family serine protease
MKDRIRTALLIALPAGLLAAYLTLAPVCNPLKSTPGVATGRSDPLDAAPGELLVKYRQPMFALSRRVVNDAVGAKEIGQIGDLGVSRIAVDPGVSLEEAARRFGSVPEVEYAEPNIIFRTQTVPNDPFYVGRQQWYYDLINAPKAWDVEKGEPSVIIAVLDTGMDITHPDLKDNLWTNRADVAGNGLDDDANGCVDDVHGCDFAETSTACPGAQAGPNPDVDDDNGHGTFVAGIAAARGSNGAGVTGMAPNVMIMPVKVLDCEGAGSALAATQGVLYAAKSGARVINMSFGADEDSLTLRAAIAEAHDRYGAVIVAAAGNSGEASVAFPARDDQVIAVAASDHRNPDAKAPFSNWGPQVTVAVPGVDIMSTLPAKYCGPGWSCVSGQPYALGSGTSFAAPLVAGTVALILSKGPPMSPDAVKSRLTTTAVDLPDGAYTHWDGAGRVQADLALEGKSYRVGVSGIVRN